MTYDDLSLTRRELLAAAPHVDSRHYDPPGSQFGNLLHSLNERAARKELLPWFLTQWKDQKAIAISLTFSKKGRHSAASAFHPELFKRENLEAIVRGLHRDLSYMVFRHAARRYGRRLGFLVVWEGFQRRHPHCHGLLEVPEGRPRFDEWVRGIFRSHPLIGEFDLKPCTDVRGWLKYLLKSWDKGDLLQDIDWVAYHAPGYRAVSNKPRRRDGDGRRSVDAPNILQSMECK